MLRYDYLTDIRKALVLLINCNVTKDTIFCGVAAFRGGLSGQIAVSDGFESWLIEVPQETVKTATWITFTDRNDNFALRIICLEEEKTLLGN